MSEISFKNSLIIHEQNTKEIIDVKECLYVIKHVDFHKTFALQNGLYNVYIDNSFVNKVTKWV